MRETANSDDRATGLLECMVHHNNPVKIYIKLETIANDYAQQIIDDRGARAGLDLAPYAIIENDFTVWFSKAPWEDYTNTSIQ